LVHLCDVRSLNVCAILLQDARCIFAIHNLSHQGVEPAASFGNFGLPDDW
jgi:glycogen synthase